MSHHMFCSTDYQYYYKSNSMEEPAMQFAAEASALLNQQAFFTPNVYFPNVQYGVDQTVLKEFVRKQM